MSAHRRGLKWGSAGQRMVKRSSQSVDIRSHTDLAGICCLFRGHIRRRSIHSTSDRYRFCSAAQFGQAKIRHKRSLVVLADQHVVRLQIAVQDPRFMGDLDCSSGGFQQASCLSLLEWPTRHSLCTGSRRSPKAW